MVKVLIPRSDSLGAKIIEPSDWEEYFSSDIINDHIRSGFTLSAGTGLKANVAIGKARLKGLFIHNDASDTAPTTGNLTANTTNYIYVTLGRDGNLEAEKWTFTNNTTGVTPTDSLFIGTATTNGSGVTGVEMGVSVTALNQDQISPIIGDGSDGDVVFSSPATITTPKQYTSLTINAGQTLDAPSSPLLIQCTGTVTVNGTISMNSKGGPAGSSGSNGAPSIYITGRGGAGGFSGGTGGSGGPGNSPGGAGGLGAGGGGGGEKNPPQTPGTSGTNAPTSEGQGGTNSISLSTIFNDPNQWNKQRTTGIGAGGGGGVAGAAGGAGGSPYGGPNGGGAGSAGAAGAGGGMVAILADTITVGPAGSITANGGNGAAAGNGGNGGGGASPDGGGGGGGGAGTGGGGGAGGLILLYYDTAYTNNGTVSASGGSGGAAGTGGAGGAGASSPAAGSGGSGGSGPGGSSGGSGNVVSQEF